MVNAIDCGVPQNRRRIFVIAAKTTEPMRIAALTEWQRQLEALADAPTKA